MADEKKLDSPVVENPTPTMGFDAPTPEEIAATNQPYTEDPKAVGKFNTIPAGATGTMIYGNYFDEEYLSKLTGTHRADVFDEMIRSDDTITMLITARKNPISKATWGVEPAKGDTPEQEATYKKQADHLRHELFERMDKDFIELIEEILTFIEHGYSLFERVHEAVNDPVFGTYVGFKNIAFRSQRTIERWSLERDGTLKTVFQQATGDVGAYTYIDGRWVTVFTHRKKGDLYEGISALRPIYGNWQRKNTFLKLIAIGLERYAINTPVGTIPAGKEDSPERTKFVNMLKAISSHQQNYFSLPAGWAVQFLQNPFDADKVVKVVQREDEGMVRSFVANHLNLGQGGSGGAYALGTDLSDQFLSIIENDAGIITRRMNKSIVKEFIDFNYGAQSRYPKITVSGINDKFSKEFSEIIKTLTDSKTLTATENLEVWVRERLGLPPLLEADAAAVDDVRKQEKAALFKEVPLQGLTFADLRTTKAKVKGQLDNSALMVAQAMKDSLSQKATTFVDRLFKEMSKAPRDQWRKIIRNQGDLPNQNEYFQAVKKALAETAARAVAQARNEVPGGRKVVFMEPFKSRMTLKLVEDTFDQLPKKIKDLILTNAALATDTQFVNLRNAVLLTASGGVDETGDLEVLHQRTLDEISKRTAGAAADSEISGAISTAATNLTAQVYNTARIEFFQSPDVLEKIEAFQFQNSDPVSPICQDLNGRIFAKNDPESDEYLPPLHHNCKSFIVPIFDLQGKSVSEDGLAPSSPSLNKFKTL